MEQTGTHVDARQHGQGLTLSQRNAVDLLAAGKTDTQVSALLALHRTTVTKWRLYDPEFQAALNVRRAEVWEAGIDRLRSLIPAALDVLAREMADPESPDRVKAAMALLKLVPITPDALAAGPGDAEEIVRRIVVERRRRKPTRTDNIEDLRAGRSPLEDECYEVQLELERRAAELPETDVS
ncbi:MAG TPA: hypothetical protein VKD90_13815 [Gemmataceae bacterium]|nr:hypothetical protein [Gemmataceae bacterium]